MLGSQSLEGLTGTGGSTSKVVPSRGYWLEASAPHHVDFPQHGRQLTSPKWGNPRGRAGRELKCLVWPRLWLFTFTFLLFIRRVTIQPTLEGREICLSLWKGASRNVWRYHSAPFAWGAFLMIASQLNCSLCPAQACYFVPLPCTRVDQENTTNILPAQESPSQSTPPGNSTYNNPVTLTSWLNSVSFICKMIS